MTDDIVAFIRARLDEDEQIALATTPGPWRHDDSKHHHEPGTARFSEAVFAGQLGPDAVCIATTGQTDDAQSMKDAAHIARHDRARVLRGVDAKRRMLDEFEPCQACLAGERCVPHDASAGQPGISRIANAQHEWFARLLASEWSTHPDYRQQWAA